jgi:predicted nucleic acid-binding protein
VIVVDASALVDALIDDGPVGDAARVALTEDPHWAAPAHLVVEVLSVVRGRLLGGKLGQERAAEVVDALSSFVIDEVGIAGLVDRIWQLRANLSTYDAAYVAAAESLGCPLVTCDGRIAKVAGVRCQVRVVTAATGGPG